MFRERKWELLPGHIADGVKDYIEKGCPTGDFLRNVISNDLKGAFYHADDTNRRRMFDIVSFFYNYCPTVAWGSPEAYKFWVEVGGLPGYRKYMDEKAA